MACLVDTSSGTKLRLFTLQRMCAMAGSNRNESLRRYCSLVSPVNAPSIKFTNALDV